MGTQQPDGIDRTLVDFDVVTAWMDEIGLPGGPVESATELQGGTQNLLVRFRRDGETYVLRRPPRHLRTASNNVLRREARVLGALATTDVPHPAFRAACTDTTVMGVVFYLMDEVVGFNPGTGLPKPHSEDASMRYAMGLAAADSIAKLGAVDFHAVGLDDFGKPDRFLERQVQRWLGELETYDELSGYPGPQIPGLAKVADWLDANRPAEFEPGIMHGDYHLANVMYSFDGPELVAIVDWEMSTIGDPLLDLGWLLATWPDPEHPLTGPAMALAPFGGFPSADEIVARYADTSDRDLRAIDWYTVLACFKLGIILEGTHARACAGKAPEATGDLLHTITLGLFERALTLI